MPRHSEAFLEFSEYSLIICNEAVENYVRMHFIVAIKHLLFKCRQFSTKCVEAKSKKHEHSQTRRLAFFG